MVLLSTIAWILLGLLALLLLLLLVLLLAPVGFSARAALEETACFEGTLDWAGGLIAIVIEAGGGRPASQQLRLCGWTRQITGGGQERGCRKPPKKPGRRRVSWAGMKPYLTREAIKEVLGCLFRLERSLNLRFRFDGEIGFEDPDLTGYLAGLLSAIPCNPGGGAPGRRQAGGWECNLRPNFAETVLRFRGAAQGRFLPAVLVWQIIRLLLSRPVRRTWWSQLRKPRLKFKKQYKEAVVND